MLYNQGRLPDPVPEVPPDPPRPATPAAPPADDAVNPELKAFQAAYQSPRKIIQIGLTLLAIGAVALVVDHVYHEGVGQRALTDWTSEKLADEKTRQSVVAKIAWFIIRRGATAASR